MHQEQDPKVQSYMHDLDLVGETTEEWLQSFDMTAHLKLALRNVWKLVEMDSLAIRKGFLSPDALLSPEDDTGFLTGIISKPDESLGAAMTITEDDSVNPNRKRKKTPDEDRYTAKTPRRSSRLSAPTKAHSDVSGSNYASQSANHVHRGKLAKVAHSPTSHLSGPDPEISEAGTRVRLRQISPSMAAVIHEIHRLDALPSSIPIGQPSDYVASKIEFPWQFKCHNGEDLCGNIHRELLDVMGADVLRRGDLGRGKFGTLGIIEWILDAREHTGWDDTCEHTVSGTLETLRDYLADALLPPGNPSALNSPVATAEHEDPLSFGGNSSTPDFESDLPIVRVREIPPDMADVIQDIHRLDSLPSTIPIGLPSEYIASNINLPCQFPSPDDYEKGELWEKIDCEFLRVMGADVLERGDLRRGKFGTLGIVEWILDAREYSGWDDICEKMVLEKLITLKDRLDSALLPPDSPSASTSLAAPAEHTQLGNPTSHNPVATSSHSTATLVETQSSPCRRRQNGSSSPVIERLTRISRSSKLARSKVVGHEPSRNVLKKRTRDPKCDPRQWGPVRERQTTPPSEAEESPQASTSSNVSASRLVTVLIPSLQKSSARRCDIDLGSQMTQDDTMANPVARLNSPYIAVSPKDSSQEVTNTGTQERSAPLASNSEARLEYQLKAPRRLLLIEGPLHPSSLQGEDDVNQDPDPLSGQTLATIHHKAMHATRPFLMKGPLHPSCHHEVPKSSGDDRVATSDSSQDGDDASGIFTSLTGKALAASHQDTMKIDGPSEIDVSMSGAQNSNRPTSKDSSSTPDESSLAAATNSPLERFPASAKRNSLSFLAEVVSHHSRVSSQPQPQPPPKSPLFLQKINIYKSTSVARNNIQATELLEIHKATKVLLETLIRGSCTLFNPDEVLSQPVTFSTSGQPSIRPWCELPENRAIFTPSVETLWYKPTIFDFEAIAKSDPPDWITTHERFLWNTLRMFHIPSPTLVERGMHYVLASLVLIGSDAEQPRWSAELPDISPLSSGARTAYSCWHHYKELSSARWAMIGSKRAEATDGCIEDLDKMIATIYTMVETFASIWASISLKADLAAAEELMKRSTSSASINSLNSIKEKLKNALSQIKVEYSNLPALVGFLCSGVKGLMIYPSDIRTFTPLRAINFLLVTSHLAHCDDSILEPMWKRTQSYIVGFLKAITQSTANWVPQELNRYHLAKALFLDFSEYHISKDITEIPIPKARNYKVNSKTYL